jgi:hypothetical protein
LCCNRNPVTISIYTDAEFGIAVSCQTHLSTAPSDVGDLHQLQLLAQQQQRTILKLQTSLMSFSHLLIGIDEDR